MLIPSKEIKMRNEPASSVTDHTNISRRGFLKGTLAGALSVGSYDVLAQIVGGSSVRGWGVPSGLVLSLIHI